MGLVSVAQLPWPHFGRTRTLNAAIYCAPVSSISAGQRGNGQVADRVTQSTDQMIRLLVRVPPSAPLYPQVKALLSEMSRALDPFLGPAVSQFLTVQGDLV